MSEERRASLFPPIVIRVPDDDDDDGQEELELNSPDDLPAGYRWAETRYEESGFAVDDRRAIPRRWQDDARSILEILKGRKR